MDFGKKFRFSLEPLEVREVPAVLGQVVELPDASAAEVARAAPVALGGSGEEYLTIKLTDVLISSREVASPSIKIDAPSLVSKKLDPVTSGTPDDAGKVQMQDFSFTMTVSKASPKLF